MSRRILQLSAWAAAFTAAVHLFIGTPEIHSPLLDSSIPREIALLLYACWHLVSVALASSAAVLFAAAYAVNQDRWVVAVRHVGAMWLLFGLTFVAVALAFGGLPMLARLPQWVLLVPVGLLALKA